MEGILPILITAIGLILFLSIINFLLILVFYKKVKSAKAIVRNGFGGTKVATSKGIYVIPSFHTFEILDLSSKTIRVELIDDNNLITKDDIRTDIKATFTIRVNHKVEHIKRISETIGVENASNADHLRELFSAKFIESLKAIARKFNHKDLLDSRNQFRNEVINNIGTDLKGFILEDCAIDYIEKQ